MSGAGDREAVFPTRQSLGIMKSKLKGAEQGHSLLKRKSEALTKYAIYVSEVRIHQPHGADMQSDTLRTEITKRIDEAKRKMGRVMQIASFSLAEVTYAVGGDIGYQVQESVKNARFRVRTKQENVSGVLLPAFESYTDENINDFAMTGLGKGGQQVQRCRETYARAVEALVELASLQTAFVILDEVIKVVNRRDINSELDELDREEFYRLKKVANKKQRDTAAQDAEMKAKKEAKAGKENGGGQDTGPSDLLAAGEEDDVIF
ncbi:H(+)-transporting V1 sector ATPase subunit D [Gnomoniopsis sp. IMI 355080]|nr:H(+)-transporting V1 sector ATPase subunit D [Gnomoniopsis sp. IMI 355080]